MKDEPALHLPGSRILLLRLLVHGFPDSLFDGLWYIEQLVGPVQGVGQQVTADSLHPEHMLQFLQ